MMLQRAFATIILALAFTASPLAAAETGAVAQPNSLDVQTKQYFAAISKADAATLADIVSSTFHVVLPDRKRLSYDAYFREISYTYFIAMPPMGTNVKIKGTTTTATGAIESVDTLRWYYGGYSEDPTSAPRTVRDFAGHELTWTKSESGAWLLDEDHILWDSDD